MDLEIKRELGNHGWFQDAGVYALVDGQYGSTGKGLVAGLLASHFFRAVDCVITNAGPNSGHTFYHNDEKYVLKQLPTFGVVAHLISREKMAGSLNVPRNPHPPRIRLTGGAIVNPKILSDETNRFQLKGYVSIAPTAAIITDKNVMADKANVDNIASTGQGVGEAIISKLQRTPEAIHRAVAEPHYTYPGVTFMEISQGFSLGINSGFYPHVTTRECTVSQGLADAGLPASVHRKTMMVVRCHPIRVGHSERGDSGPSYIDQQELDWITDFPEIEPETTTVTGRVRRIFTWSEMQFEESLRANAPDAIFLNFVNYLSPGTVDEFVERNILSPYIRQMGRLPDAIIVGYGPKNEDAKLWGKS